MIKYEIISFSTKLLSMQVKYSLEGKPDFITRMAIDTPITEEGVHAVAKRQATQAEFFWEREAEAETFTPTELTGETKRTIVVPKGDYDPAVETLVEQVIEEDDVILVKFVGVPLTEGEKATYARNKRNALLHATDNMALVDRPMSEEVAAYREALRDLPQQEGFPNDISWPVMPID